MSKDPHPAMVRHQEQYYGGVAWANELARRGYVVLVHDTFTFGSRRMRLADLPGNIRNNFVEANPEAEDEIQRYNQFAGNHEHLIAKSLFSAGMTWPGVFIFDDRRALDYLVGFTLSPVLWRKLPGSRSAGRAAARSPRRTTSAPAGPCSRPARSGDPIRAILTLYDPAKQNSALVAGAKRPLAADFTAPFGYYPNPGDLGILGMLSPEKFLEKEGFFLVQPYDRNKTPIVFVHGLMSVPQMWIPVMAAIESDPALRGKFQFWVFAYPTGNPIAYSALQLRQALASVYKVYPGTRNMVIINHSLGGDLTHLQVINSGDVLVKGIFKEDAPKIMALPPSSLVKQALIFKANPRIKRVIFVAAPHRGAPLAVNFIGRIGAALIHIPGALISRIGTTTIEEAAAASGLGKNYVPNSINALEPTNPLLISMNEVPIRTPFHSIIGVAGSPKAPLEKTSDTVVPYWSSHLDAALSEKIVPYPHTAMFVKPEATDEIKRILHLHLASIGDAH